MSRSVSYLNGAQAVAYLSADDETADSWDFFVEDITEQLKSLFPSLQDTDRWGGYYDGDENHIILENGHCEIAIAEYCGLVSISMRAIDEWDGVQTGLHTRWVEQVKDKFLSIGTLRHQGTFSNGEAIFSTINEPTHTYSSKEGLCGWLESEA